MGTDIEYATCCRVLASLSLLISAGACDYRRRMCQVGAVTCRRHLASWSSSFCCSDLNNNRTCLVSNQAASICVLSATSDPESKLLSPNAWMELSSGPRGALFLVSDSLNHVPIHLPVLAAFQQFCKSCKKLRAISVQGIKICRASWQRPTASAKRS